MHSRVCVQCGAEYDPDGAAQRYCRECGIQRREAQRIERYQRARAKKLAAKEAQEKCTR